MPNSNPWHEFEWLVAKVGRQKGQREGLNVHDAPTTKWLRCGWIKQVEREAPASEPEPAPEPAEVETATLDAPPFHRAMRHAPRRKAE